MVKKLSSVGILTDWMAKLMNTSRIDEKIWTKIDL